MKKCFYLDLSEKETNTDRHMIIIFHHVVCDLILFFLLFLEVQVHFSPSFDDDFFNSNESVCVAMKLLTCSFMKHYSLYLLHFCDLGFLLFSSVFFSSFYRESPEKL